MQKPKMIQMLEENIGKLLRILGLAKVFKTRYTSIFDLSPGRRGQGPS